MDKDEFKDMPKKYSNTYFQVRPINTEDPWQTVYADDFRIWWAEDDTQVDYYTAKTRVGWIKSTEYEFKFDFPPLGVLNFKETVVVANRFPARQWKKAATHENYSVYMPTAPLLAGIVGNYTLPKSITLDFKFGTSAIHELYSSKYFSYKDALSHLKIGKRLACAITKEFFVTNSHYNDAVLLWRGTAIVAEINEGAINYVAPLFKQETQDFFKRNT